MPHITITLYEGRDAETKRDIAEKVATSYYETFGVPANEVSISMIETSRADFSTVVNDRLKADNEELIVSSRFFDSQ